MTFFVPVGHITPVTCEYKTRPFLPFLTTCQAFQTMFWIYLTCCVYSSSLYEKIYRNIRTILPALKIYIAASILKNLVSSLPIVLALFKEISDFENYNKFTNYKSLIMKSIFAFCNYTTKNVQHNQYNEETNPQ